MIDLWNVAGVVLAATTVAGKLATFWIDSTAAPIEAQELINTVQLLKISAQNVEIAFRERPNPSDIEKRNRQSIADLGEKCLKDLRRLQNILPESQQDAGRLHALRTHLARKLCEDSVRSIVQSLQLCQSALGIQLQALAIFKLEHAQDRDHPMIQSQWTGVLGRADDLLSISPRGTDPDWDNCVDNVVISIRDSASTYDGRSEIIASSPPPSRKRRQSYVASTAPYSRGDSDSGIAILEDSDDTFVNAADIPIHLSIVVATTLQMVEASLEARKYHEAAGLQMRAIEYRKKFSGSRPIPTEVICRDDMKLADIYRRKGGSQNLKDAEWMLDKAITRLNAEELDPPELKNPLLAELYHDFGRIRIDLNNLVEGSKNLSHAYILIIESPSPSTRLLRSVGTMLYRIYTDLGQPEAAEALDNDAESRCGFSLKTLAYCQGQSFDTGSNDFKFDKPHEGTTPLHAAVKDGKDEILKDMLKHRPNVNVTDKERATPFLLACSQQDIVVIDLLLSHGADPALKDDLQRNGLHRCQRASGGTGAARRLLAGTPPAIEIDAKDSYSNSALYLAASKGNLKMVRLLLTLGATPDILGPGGCTPLMGAVQATMKSQETKVSVLRALLDHGADAGLRCARKQTAADMANDGQIRKMLKEKANERQGPKPARRFTLQMFRGKAD